ncbi:MAG: glycosyltransferase family A protein [Anaerolineaceae bacterium]
MRIGQNPAKAGIKARKPKQFGIGIICYIPNQTGYFEESLKIVKLEIASLRKNTDAEFDLYLFDNNSCPEVQKELVQLNQDGVIDFLTLSRHNIGKFGAMNWLMASMTNEWIVYSDSDFFFRAGWLQESMRLVEAFPSAGLVTAQPNFFDQLEGKSRALAKLDPTIASTHQQRLDQVVIEDYCRGIGANEELRNKYLNEDSTILQNKANGIQAVFGATTAQFLGSREKFQQVFPLPHDFLIAREEDNELNRKVDSLGWLELSTLKPYVVHMGNHLDEGIIQEAQADGLLGEFVRPAKPADGHKNNLAWRFLVACNRNAFLRKVFKRLYVNLFELYSIEKK